MKRGRGRPRGTLTRTQPSERDIAMFAMYRDGKTLAEIGTVYGVTREYVRQCITKWFGRQRSDGGAHLRAAERRARKATEKDIKSIRRHGCTWEQYAALRAMKIPTRAFAQQRSNAKVRGIGWELSLWEWWLIWQASGHWHERGRGQGYVMCRRGDTGPYAVGNVFIAPARHNSSERRQKVSGLPIGVSKHRNRFIAHRCIHGRTLRLGSFKSPEEAHAAYLAAGYVATTRTSTRGHDKAEAA